MKVEDIVLDNKLRTMFIDQPGSQVASIQIWFKAGSALETKDEKGIAHFLEHMFFKGTKKYPSMMLAKTVENFGGEINAFTSFDYTCYYINCPVKNTLESIDVLMDMVSNPIFSEDDITPEKDVVFEEYRRSIDNPSQFNFFNVQKNSFPTQYRTPVLGTEKSIKSFTKKQLIDFRKKFYNIQNAALIVAGDLKNKDNVKKKITSFSLPSGSKSEFSKFNLKSKESSLVHEKSVNQSTVTFSIQAPDYSSKDAAIEDLAINCLAFGDISPLYKEIVSQKMIASGVSGSSMFFSRGGCHFLKLAFPTENYKKVVAELTKTLIKIFKRGFSESEINRIKNQYLSSKIYEKETIESFAFSIGHSFAQTGETNCEENFIQRMKDATKDEVNLALLNVFEKSIHAVVQTPLGESKKLSLTEISSFSSSLKTEIKKQKARAQKKSSKTSSAYDPEVISTKLASGVEFIYRQNSMTPTFTLHTYIKGGAAHEDEKTNGIYNLLAKNITYGYKGTDYESMKNDLELKSSYINGFSGKNAYGLTCHGLSEHTPQLFSHYFSTFTKPLVPQHYLSVEKELLNRTIHNQKEDPVKHCFRTFNNLVFNKHPYSFDLIGTEKSIKSLTRKKIMDLHSKNLKDKEMVITYCGSASYDEVKKLITEKLAETIKNRSTVIKKEKSEIKPISGQHIELDFDREQTHIMIGKPAFKVNSKQDLMLKIFTAYLSGQSSELFVEVRDRQGLCYSCQPLHYTALEAGYWGIYIGTGFDKAEKAIKAIYDIINKYAKNGLSKTEFNRVKKMIQGQNALNVQTNDDYANFYSIGILHGFGIDFQHKTLEQIQKIEHAQFNLFLKSFLKGKYNQIKVGRLNKA